MKKTLALSAFILFMSFIFSCSPKTNSANGSGGGKNIITRAGQRKFIDPANMNLSVRPQDDFNEYANGTWLKNTPIPTSESRWGSFNLLRDFNINALKTILDNISSKTNTPGSIQQKAADFYASGMDSVAIENAGISALEPTLNRIKNVKNYKELLQEITTLYEESYSPIFGMGVRQDDKNSLVMVPNIGQGGLHLPDRDYYLKTDERSVKIKTAYVEHIGNVFKLIGFTDAQAKTGTNDVMKVETALAKASMTRVERRSPEKQYNKMTIADLEAIAPQMDWASFFKKNGVTNDYYIVRQPEFLKEVSNLLKNGQLEEWKHVLLFDVVKSNMTFLSKPFVDENFNFGKVLSGTTEMQPRWKRISGTTDGFLGEALGQIYVTQYFKPEAKQRLLGMLDNMDKVFQKRIAGLDWMSDATKAKAQLKLSTIVRKIGYPDKWKDYSTLTIDKNAGYLKNVIAARKFLHKENINRLGKPVDRTLWGMTPPTVNAYYNPSMNEIVFPAGILQFPFYDPNADDAVNYGGIVAVIGHEMTHGFDDQGRKYDADGNLKSWWTDEDGKKFDAKAKMVEDQFSNYTVLDTVHVNGKLTLGENLADLGGLSMAYEAFKTYSPQAQSKDRIDGFTPDQRFFLSWAQVWRSKSTPESTVQLVNTDPHAPDKLRTNGPLTNMQEFYNVYNVQPGDKMYKSPELRAKIW